MKALKFFILILTLLIFTPSLTTAATNHKVSDDQDIVHLTATGMGMGPANRSEKSSMYRTYARQAAKLDALRVLAEQVGGISVESYTEITELDVTADMVTSKINRGITTLVAQYARMTSEKVLPGGGYEVTMEMKVPKNRLK